MIIPLFPIKRCNVKQPDCSVNMDCNPDIVVARMSQACLLLNVQVWVRTNSLSGNKMKALRDSSNSIITLARFSISVQLSS